MLDSEGLARAVLRDRDVNNVMTAAKDNDVRVLTSAATLVEVMHPRLNRSAFEWTLAQLSVEPVTESLARRAAALLAAVRRHGHRHAIDAMVAATALAAAAPVTVLTSDLENLRLLCGDRVTVIGL